MNQRKYFTTRKYLKGPRVGREIHWMLFNYILRGNLIKYMSFTESKTNQNKKCKYNLKRQGCKWMTIGPLLNSRYIWWVHSMGKHHVNLEKLVSYQNHQGNQNLGNRHRNLQMVFFDYLLITQLNKYVISFKYIYELGLVQWIGSWIIT